MSQVNVTIDGRNIAVEAGTTVLAAARHFGIHIPTLCSVEGLDPSASCFVCAVQVEGKRTLSPSCALPVADGMVVTTDSADIRAARKMALELLFSDHAGDCIAPCAVQCPAGLDIPGFVRRLGEDDVAGAMDVLLDRLALPGSLGRICPRLCEQSCRRCGHDEGLAIAALHRYAPDRDADARHRTLPECAPPTGKSVAIIGAGPAGLSAALYLLQRGHTCAIYDAHAEPGGMLRYGIPEYRLPKDALDIEIDRIRQLGAEFHMHRRWGADFTLANLRHDHDAVFVAIGAQHAQWLGCEGEELALSGVEFLECVARGNPPTLGGRVIVLGGGNTAMDAARSAVRVQRQAGCGDGAAVQVIYRRTRQQMPCLLEEADGAEAEGVRIEYLAAPVRLERNGDHTVRLTCQRMELGRPDASGRRTPQPLPGSEFSLEATTVIAAIGQTVQRTIAEQEGLRVTAWGIAADPQTLATNLPGVFAGGDAVLGADLAVRAVAAGRAAAVSIDQYLHDQPVLGPTESVAIQMTPLDEHELAAIFRNVERTPRVPLVESPRAERISKFAEVRAGLDDEAARREATRCMSCGCRKATGCDLRRLATEYRAEPYRFIGDRRRFEQDVSHPEIVYEPGKCIMCGACVEIAEAAGEPLGVSIVGRGFGVAMTGALGSPLSEALQRSALRCADACPTGALARRGAGGCGVEGCGGCGTAVVPT